MQNIKSNYPVDFPANIPGSELSESGFFNAFYANVVCLMQMPGLKNGVLFHTFFGIRFLAENAYYNSSPGYV